MSSPRSSLRKFFLSPQNQTGLILLASAIPGYVAQVESHSTTLAIAAGAIFAGFLHLIVPENTALITDGPRFVSDSLGAIEAKNIMAVPAILSDAANVAGDILPADKTASRG